MIPVTACSTAELIEYETLVFKHLEHKNYKNEVNLYRKKWFDYRFIHPVQATEMFIMMYKDAHRMIAQIRIDQEQGRYRTGVKGTSDRLFERTKTVYKGFWRARQVADENGIPYDFYCNHAMRFADSRIWTYMPRPNQLYSKDMKEYIIDKWKEELDCRLVMPISSFYTVENKDHLYYKDYIEYIAYIAKRRSYPANILNYLIDEVKSITAETADTILSKISSH